MKRILASFAIVFLMVGVSMMGAQDQQQPGPYDQQQPGPEGPPPDASQQPQASPPPGQPQQNNQLQTGAARVSFIHGDVSSQRGDNGDWVALTLNMPIMPGDRIATAHDSRTEIQLDYAGVLRMSSDATANLKALDRSNIQVQVGQGLVTYSVLRAGGADTEIDTPNAGIHPLGVGDYRILVHSDSQTQLIMRTGSADVSTAQGSTHVEQGQMITIAGTDNAQYKTDPAPGRDDWDTWNSDRNQIITSADSWRHTDPYYVGSQDLDSYGTWSEIPDYGPVWTPRADAGWAPYRAGRWVYEPYYGWTWVSYEPWGWAPYHYGRWMTYGGNWCWWPGPIGIYPGYYPIWAPAYVSFFGFGGGGFGFGIGFGFGFGRVGWLPIGPGDWFHPWYGGWGARYGAVNIANFNGIHEGFGPLGRGRAAFSNVNGAFSNDRIRGGISSMASNEFGRGAVSGRQEAMSAASFRQASAMSGRMPISPSRESFSATNRAAGTATIRNASAGSQRFFSSSRARSSFGNASRSAQGVESNSRRAGNTERGSSSTRGGWQHFSPSSSASRGGAYGGGYSNSNSRPTLNMRQNIVTPRNGPLSAGYGSSAYGRSTYGGSSNGSGSTRGSYSEPRSSSAPNGGYSTPRGSYSAPRTGGGSGGSSAPRGNYSSPRGGSSGGSSRGGGVGSGGGSSRGSSSRGGGGGRSSGHR